MKTILVPTDYSATARNAAKYALTLAIQIGASKIVLYNAYEAPPVVSEPAMPAIPYVDIDVIKKISEDAMVTFSNDLKVGCPEGSVIETKTEYAILSNEIATICDSTQADLIVMGVTGTSKFEEVLIGSTAINVMTHTKVPVMIVPHNNSFSGIKNVMLATDLKKVVESTPANYIRNILEASKASLHVVNIYEDQSELFSEKIYQQELLHAMLKDYSPAFHLINNDNFVDGINEYVDKNNIDLVIAIPKKHGFFAGLFKERHTKKLAFHTHVPLLYLHNDDL